MFVFVDACCCVFIFCLNSDAGTQGWLRQQVRTAIDAIRDYEADRLDHSVNDNVRMAACTRHHELQCDLNIYVVEVASTGVVASSYWRTTHAIN